MEHHIDLGSNVVAAWTNHIAVSVDGGVSWDTVHKTHVTSITQRRHVDGKNQFNAGTPQKTHERISIHLSDGREISFDVKDVANQSSWNVGGPAGLAAAVSDLATWTN